MLIFNVSGKMVLEKLDFLNDCLTPPSKFVHSTREQAMSKFYSALTKKLPELNSWTSSAPTTSWLCLRLFEKLVDINYPLSSKTEMERAVSDLDDQEKDTLAYIGGALLTKLKQKITRLSHNETRLEILTMIDAMSSTSANCDGQKLTDTLNRGNLKYLTQETRNMFHLLELEMRKVCSKVDDKPVQLIDFEVRCSSINVITSAYETAVYSCETSKESKDILFSRLVQLYYKMRVHHECNLFRQKLKVGLSASKGLRQVLHEKC